MTPDPPRRRPAPCRAHSASSCTPTCPGCRTTASGRSARSGCTRRGSSRYVPLVAELDSLAAEGHRDVLTLGVTPVLAAQLDHPRMRREQARTWAALWELRCPRAGVRPGDPHRRASRATSMPRPPRRRRPLADALALPAGPPSCARCATPGSSSCSAARRRTRSCRCCCPRWSTSPCSVGLDDSRWRLGARPRGIWSPECGYRPGPRPTPSQAAGVRPLRRRRADRARRGGHPHAAWRSPAPTVVAVPRDLEVTNLIWSSRIGLPRRRRAYRDFHAREPSTGIRLWAITEPDVPRRAKAPYDPDAAAAQVRRDVAHFVTAVRDRLRRLHHERTGRAGPRRRGIRHRAVRALVARGAGVPRPGRPRPARGRRHRDHAREGPGRRVTSAGELELGAGSWGAGKDFSVWDGPQVSARSPTRTTGCNGAGWP